MNTNINNKNLRALFDKHENLVKEEYKFYNITNFKNAFCMTFYYDYKMKKGHYHMKISANKTKNNTTSFLTLELKNRS